MYKYWAVLGQKRYLPFPLFHVTIVFSSCLLWLSLCYGIMPFLLCYGSVPFVLGLCPSNSLLVVFGDHFDHLWWSFWLSYDDHFDYLMVITLIILWWLLWLSYDDHFDYLFWWLFWLSFDNYFDYLFLSVFLFFILFCLIFILIFIFLCSNLLVSTFSLFQKCFYLIY